MGSPGAGATGEIKFIALAHQQRLLIAAASTSALGGGRQEQCRGSRDQAVEGKQPGPASSEEAGPREGCGYQGEGRLQPWALGSVLWGWSCPGCMQPCY